MTKSVPTPNAVTPSARAKQGQTSSGRDRRRRPSQQKLRRRGPPKIPGAEVFKELEIALSKVEQKAMSGDLDGRPDLVMEAFMELDDLCRLAYETFFELHRETCENVWALNQFGLLLDESVKAFWSELWKKTTQK